MNIAWCVAMVIILLKVLLMVFLRILKKKLMIFTEEMCVVALAPALITISSSTFHPLLLMLFKSGWSFSIFVVIIFEKNLSLQM